MDTDLPIDTGKSNFNRVVVVMTHDECKYLWRSSSKKTHPGGGPNYKYTDLLRVFRACFLSKPRSLHALGVTVTSSGEDLQIAGVCLGGVLISALVVEGPLRGLGFSVRPKSKLRRYGS